MTRCPPANDELPFHIHTNHTTMALLQDTVQHENETAGVPAPHSSPATSCITVLVDTLHKPLTLCDDSVLDDAYEVATMVRPIPLSGGARRKRWGWYPMYHAPECSLQSTASITWQLDAHHAHQPKQCCHMLYLYSHQSSTTHNTVIIPGPYHRGRPATPHSIAAAIGCAARSTAASAGGAECSPHTCCIGPGTATRCGWYGKEYVEHS